MGIRETGRRGNGKKRRREGEMEEKIEERTK